MEAGDDLVEAPAPAAARGYQPLAAFRLRLAIPVEASAGGEAERVHLLAKEAHDHRIARWISRLAYPERQGNSPAVPDEHFSQGRQRHNVAGAAMMAIVGQGSQQGDCRSSCSGRA
jgi:hypothetical protein